MKIRRTLHQALRGRLKLLAVTSGLAVAATLAAPTGAQAEAQSLSAADLAEVSSSVRAADIGGTAWYVDRATDTVVVTVDSTVSKSEIASIRAEAGDKADAVDIRRTNGKFTKYIAGGQAITTSGSRCSLGFNVQSSSGTRYALTAGHCTNIGSSWNIGTRAGSSFPNNDYGIIRHSNSSAADGRVYLYNGSYRDITGAANPSVGQSVQRSGSTTGLHSGRVTGLNATVNYGGGDVVYGMIQTNVCAEPGDSGGPLFSGGTALGLTSGGSGNCSSGGTTFYQPVVEALNAYGVSVL